MPPVFSPNQIQRIADCSLLQHFWTQSPPPENAVSRAILKTIRQLHAGGGPHRLNLPAPHDVCEQLRISPTEKVFFIKRLVFADEHPAIYLNDYFAPQVQASTPRWDTFDGNVVQFLFTTLETPLYQLHSRIRAVALTDETAQMLQQPVNTPAIGVWSTIYTIKHEPVTFSKLWFNSNIIELETVRILHKTG